MILLLLIHNHPSVSGGSWFCVFWGCSHLLEKMPSHLHIDSEHLACLIHLQVTYSVQFKANVTQMAPMFHSLGNSKINLRQCSVPLFSPKSSWSMIVWDLGCITLMTQGAGCIRELGAFCMKQFRLVLPGGNTMSAMQAILTILAPQWKNIKKQVKGILTAVFKFWKDLSLFLFVCITCMCTWSYVSYMSAGAHGGQKGIPNLSELEL